jgi:threonine aldolase
MRRAMADAEVGDDVFGDDPTAIRLQEMVADLLGFDAALWTPSGVMANEIAIRLLTRPGDEVLADDRSHVVQVELAGMAVLSGVMPRTVRTTNGHLTADDIRGALRPRSYLRSDLAAVVLENTHNFAGGTVASVDQMRAAIDEAHVHKLLVHIDGARIWNAAIALNVAPGKLLEGADTAMVTLSKGLCAPAGSMLLSTRDRIQEARRVRKQLGGGMRQIGVLAAAGIVGIREMMGRLADDHANARALGERLADCPGVSVLPVPTNIVIASLPVPRAEQLVSRVARQNVLITALDDFMIRLVTHHDVNRIDCTSAADVITKAVADL